MNRTNRAPREMAQSIEHSQSQCISPRYIDPENARSIRALLTKLVFDVFLPLLFQYIFLEYFGVLTGVRYPGGHTKGSKWR